MADHIVNRGRILRQLKEEMVGPCPAGEELDCDQKIVFEKASEGYKPWRQKGSGEEILQRDSPIQRYGVGVLYPMGIILSQEEDEIQRPVVEVEQDADSDETPEPLTPSAQKAIRQMEDQVDSNSMGTDENDLDLSNANRFRPSTMAISFFGDFPPGSTLVVKATGGRYRSEKVQIGGKERVWWLRSPFNMEASFNSDSVCGGSDGAVRPDDVSADNTDNLNVVVEVFSRVTKVARRRLVTVCLVNRTQSTESNSSSVFQVAFDVSIVSDDGGAHILPYPTPETQKMDDEEQSLALLYRHYGIFAVGHGCGAGWDDSGEDSRVVRVTAECLPTFETPSITPDIKRRDGTPLEVDMATLAGLTKREDELEEVDELIQEYESWINRRKLDIPSLPESHRPVATSHLSEAARCVGRMRDGLDWLRHDDTARLAFQLANRAILLQQLRSRREPRRLDYDAQAKRLCFSEDFEEPDPLNHPKDRGMWRAFQIGFLLMCIKSAVESEAPDREVVELLWFPTGGGKTEAYLALAAFALFMRRLNDPQDDGVHVLMRYTLRLLTTQQFQRASGLICAMEDLRRSGEWELGSTEFSIGIWLGGTTTPNTRRQALDTLRSLQKGDTTVENLFILAKCPWCAAQMGPVKFPKQSRGVKLPKVLGYEQRESSVVFRCPDRSCEFADRLPILVIDEDIYESPPSLVIGTVDKFAMLAWKPEARGLFGIGEDGERIKSPPGLVIQDELHLISGPLGSMVGLYETLIEELCTDRRGGEPVPPKRVCSTATIRRFKQQIRALYAREETALFPPPGLTADDSFFARYAKGEDGQPLPGRVYVGILAPGLGSLQTVQVRVFTALLQAPLPLSERERDPWWTNLVFYNSLRELGGALTLFQSDIPVYVKVAARRSGADVRYLRNVRELTGRLKSDEIPSAIAELETACTSAGGKPVDVCLASNIIEVGVDIDRLSLMSVVGQPKTTSQYIQVTGRIGRRWWERPGLVITLYSPSKPRDRSHFEQFRSYHQRLYAQVEPTSVTPFSPPALDRALHALMAAFARQAGDSEVAASPYPFPEDMINQLRDLLLPRITVVDPEEIDNFEQVFQRRADQWRRWERTRWDGRLMEVETPLLRVAGAYVSPERAHVSWATPMSMRNVDAEGQVEITQLYLTMGEEDA